MPQRPHIMPLSLTVSPSVMVCAAADADTSVAAAAAVKLKTRVSICSPLSDGTLPLGHDNAGAKLRRCWGLTLLHIAGLTPLLLALMTAFAMAADYSP